MEEPKSQALMESFVDYCESNPEQRFWQALRNWSGEAFIYSQNEGEVITSAIAQDGHIIDLQDTFYRK